MNHLHQGTDYKFYKIYLWVGGVLVVASFFLTGVVLDIPGNYSGPMTFLIMGSPLLLWVAGILLYWWWVFLFKENRELRKLAEQEQQLPGISALKSLDTLHPEMSLNGGSVEEMINNAKVARRPILVWFGSLNILALWICGPVTLGSLLPTFPLTLPVWLGGVVVWIIGMLIASPFIFRWGSTASEKAYLAPLGLKVTKTPGLKPSALGMLGSGQVVIPDGPAIVEGQRQGRLVHLEFIDKYSLVLVQARLPEFSVESRDGKLEPDPKTPANISKAIKSLRKAKRWQGIEVFAGNDGIAIQRESKAMNMWLYDLWLAEYILDKLE